MLGVGLGAGLVAEDPEGQHGGVDRAVLGDDLVEHRRMRGQVVGVEPLDVHGHGTGRPQRGNLLVKAVAVTGGQHHRRPRCQSQGKFGADLAATAENHDHIAAGVARVVHGCDYHLR